MEEEKYRNIINSALKKADLKKLKIIYHFLKGMGLA